MGIADLSLEIAAASLGIEIQIVAAYDFWDKAVEVYNRNLNPICEVKNIDDIERLPVCDFVYGGPPCQPYSKAGRKLGSQDPRDKIPKTLELIKGKNYLIENVKQVMEAPYIARLCASDFGDCTSRTRTFHSSVPLLGIPDLHGRTTISAIRDLSEDERILRKRGMAEKAGHGHDVRGYGKLLSVVKPLDISLRGFSRNVRPYTDEETLGTIVGNSWHANPGFKLVGCRNPSILEMQRAHSIPDNWNWGKITKTDKGRMIANSWPLRLGISVWTSFLLNYETI